MLTWSSGKPSTVLCSAPLRVERIVAEEKIGVVIEVCTEHHCYQLRASPRGRVLSCTKNEPVQKEEE